MGACAARHAALNDGVPCLSWPTITGLVLHCRCSDCVAQDHCGFCSTSAAGTSGSCLAGSVKGPSTAVCVGNTAIGKPGLGLAWFWVATAQGANQCP